MPAPRPPASCQPKPATPGGADAMEAIWREVAALAPGEVASYGEVARRAGLPGRARLVARALRLAPRALDLPWHRVVTASGRIAFPPDSGGFREQRTRLIAEGHRVDDRGRLARPPVAVDLDAAVWGPPRVR